MLSDSDWKLKYTPEDGDLVDVFYVPALEDAARYDRLTGYFNAGALALAARGVEGLIRNDGRMRLIVGCTLDTAEIEAIERGEELRDQVGQKLIQLPLAPPDASANEALELLAWMIGQGHLEVKVAVPCNKKRRPVSDTAIFHEKSGIIEDRTGHKIAWTGSLNETAAGWKHNWESINVYRSWGPEPERVASEERNFARLWADQSARAIVLNVPDAARQDLLRFMPKTELPARLKATTPPARKPHETTEPTGVVEPPPVPASDRRQRVWTFIQRAPAHAPGGAQVARSDCSDHPLAAPDPRVRAALHTVAAEASDRRRGRSGEDDSSRTVAAAGLARRSGETHSDPGTEGGAQPVADRAAREVQPELAHLRRPHAAAARIAGTARKP